MENQQGLPLVQHIRDILINDHGEVPTSNVPRVSNYIVFYFYAVNNLHSIVNSEPDGYLANLIKDAINNNLLDYIIKAGYTQMRGEL